MTFLLYFKKYRAEDIFIEIILSNPKGIMGPIQVPSHTHQHSYINGHLAKKNKTIKTQ